MKILHTSDIHLTDRDNPHFEERWDALKKIVSLSRKLEIDVIVISGDLFDNPVAGEVLRGEIRGIFESSGSKIIILPGNHDKDVFSGGNFYGKNVVILDNNSPVERVNGFEFWGIPFFEANSAQVALKIGEIGREVDNPERSILILHGELLDISGGWDAYGDEGREQYFPFKLSYFEKDRSKQIGWRYILAGHFHSNFTVRVIKGENDAIGYFVYPGSPVSITEKETGKRKVNVFEFGKAPEEYPIDSFYYEKLKIELSPFNSVSPLEYIRENINKKKLGSGARLLVEIGGFYNGERIGMSENELIPEIKKLLERWNLAREPIVALTDIGRFLRDELYEAFKEKLDNIPIEEERDRIRELMIKAMIGTG